MKENWITKVFANRKIILLLQLTDVRLCHWYRQVFSHLDCYWQDSLVVRLRVYCTLYSIQHSVYSIQYSVYNIQYSVYSIQYTVYSIVYTVYSIVYTVDTVNCILHPVHTVLCSQSVTEIAAITIRQALHSVESPAYKHLINTWPGLERLLSGHTITVHKHYYFVGWNWCHMKTIWYTLSIRMQ